LGRPASPYVGSSGSRWIDPCRASCVGDGSCSSITTSAWICTRIHRGGVSRGGQARRGAQASRGPKQTQPLKRCVAPRRRQFPSFRQGRSGARLTAPNSYEARFKPWLNAKAAAARDSDHPLVGPQRIEDQFDAVGRRFAFDRSMVSTAGNSAPRSLSVVTIAFRIETPLSDIAAASIADSSAARRS
jgi:hypothetical protein